MRVISICLLCIAISVGAFAKEYHVSIKGNDQPVSRSASMATNGITEQNPQKVLQQHFHQSGEAGSLAGTYS